MKIITVTSNIKTGKSYQVEAREEQSLDIVWDSQKSWFMIGSKVILSDDKGNTKTYIK